MATTPSAAAPRPRPYWLLIAAACLVPAALDAFQAYMQARLDGRASVPWTDIVFAGSEWLFLGALTPITYVLARRVPLRRQTIGRTALVHLAGALVLCAGWAGAGVALRYALGTMPAGTSLGRHLASWMLTSLPWSVFMYFAVLGCVYAFTYFIEARKREAQLAEARLGALRMQLNPHFLFNSLNAIAVLVRDQNTRDASRMLELLGGVLRQVLQSDARPEVTLDEELRFIAQYLAIEQVRFSDRLQVRWAVDPVVRDARVPALLLQPLVENAIRHGVAPRSEPGTIEVAAAEAGGDLVLSVRDDGRGYAPVAGQTGVGLPNTRARLDTLFGDASGLAIGRAEGGGTLATIRIPLRRTTDA